jgi:hypothetical protein
MQLLNRAIARTVSYAQRFNLQKLVLLGVQNPESFCSAINSLIDDGQVVDDQVIKEFSQTYWDNLVDMIHQDDLVKQTAAANRLLVRIENRALYRPAPQMSIVAKEGGRAAWSFVFDLTSAGVLEQWLAARGTVTNTPIACLVQNRLPIDRQTGRPQEIKLEEWKVLRAEGWRGSQQSLVWNWPAVREQITAMFPKVIDFGGYNHRLRAPLLPQGYQHETQVAFVQITDDPTALDQEPMPSIASGVDGSGVYDPDHPQMALLVRTYGKVIFQLTVINPDSGLFAKGIIRPLTNACVKYGTQVGGEYPTGIFMDHAQVKGALKDVHKRLESEGTSILATGSVGVMDARRGDHTLMLGFEQTENVDPSARAYTFETGAKVRRGQEVEVRGDFNTTTERVLCVMKRGERRWVMTTSPRQGYSPKAYGIFNDIPYAGTNVPLAASLLRNLQGDALEQLNRGGVDAMLRKVAKDDPDQVGLLYRLAEKCKEYQRLGLDIEIPNIKGLPMVKSAIEDRLQRQLWSVATGAGVEGEQRVIIMDAAVTPGTAVVAGVRVGRDVAIWRFPTVLSCGLVVLKAAMPLASHLVDDQIVENAIFMHPDDVRMMQGDDDGDFVGVSTDPRVITLFENRIDSRFFAIEPDGTKLDTATESEEGFIYGLTDPMGPVGIFTLTRSRLLAVGDFWGALACSVLIQEAIDSAKRKVRWTDYRVASQPHKWEFVNNAWRLHYPGSNAFLPDDEQPTNMVDFVKGVMAWANVRMTAHGCNRKWPHKQNPISWYKHEIGSMPVKKRVVLQGLVKCVEKSEGYVGKTPLHLLHDWVWEWWQKVESEFQVQEDNLPLRSLMVKLMTVAGYQVHDNTLLEQDVKELEDRIGLSAFAREMKTVMGREDDVDPDLRNREVNRARDGLNAKLAATATMQDLVDVWAYHMTPRWKYRHKENSSWKYTSDEKLIGEMSFSSGCGPHRVDRPQKAFRAVTFPRSPIMTGLGIVDVQSCDFWLRPGRTAPTKLEGFVKWALVQDDPYKATTELIYSDVVHAQDITDANGEPVPMHRCQHCKDTAQTALVRAVRQAKRQAQTEAMAQLIERLRTHERTQQYDMPERTSTHESASEFWSDNPF